MVKRATVAISLSVLMLGGTLIAQADRTVIDGPGFKVEKRDGWFGTSERTYTDALGNTYVKKKGLFGRTKKESRIFGTEVVQKGDDVSVKSPDGTPLLTRKKRLFGGRETRVNGNGLWDAVAGMLKGSPATTP